MPDSAPTPDLSAIHQLLLAHFNEEELKTLCLSLGVDYADLPASGRVHKARELVTYLDRRGRLEALRTAVRLARPHAIWPGDSAGPTTEPDPDAANWPPNPADIDRLVTIVQTNPRFATPDRRLDFLQEVLADSPRQKDIMGLLDVTGPARSAAVRLVNRFIQFGQDKPGRETLGLLISALLTDYGAHPDADFLRGLLDRYPMGITVDRQHATPELPPPVRFPTTGRFLQPEDRRWLAFTVGNLSRFQDLPGRRNLLIESHIPDQWIGEISLDRGGVLEVARTVINDLETRGALPQSARKHALAGLLEALLDSVGVNDAIRAVALMFRYQLLTDTQELSRLSERFGVPFAAVEGDTYQTEEAPSSLLPAALRRDKIVGKLEALYANGRENWLDVDFLTRGASAAQSVCRLEWDRRGHGSGFLLAPDLILTNYHVLYPPEYQGALETRLRTCVVRFGAYRTPEGGVSAGNKVVKLHREAVVAASEVGQLDYALLRLKEPVEDGARIIRAALAEDEIYEEQYANIIQHPLGGAMKVALRYNQVVKLLPQRVYYLSDTLEGSSGSPVFDDEWRVIAVHRAAGLKDETGQVVYEANEGVPILDILSEIRPYLTGASMSAPNENL